MFEEPLRNLGCATIPAGPTDAATQLDIMQKLRVSGYVGTPSFLMHLAQKAEEKGLNLRKDLFLEVAFVTGERLSEKIRGQMEKKYDIIMRQGYGMAMVAASATNVSSATGCTSPTAALWKSAIPIPAFRSRTAKWAKWS